MSQEAIARPSRPAPEAQRRPEGAGKKAVAATIRWAQVLPVNFDREDTSLTQAELAVLK
ncbi:MAG: hypothetical protein ACLPJH_06460 [Myxococcaceae bacterium]